ncbi:MAG: 30S ribosomal protein S5 [Candidatus Dadabacteria bacterium]|nr:MAG: 30S ribosomal protein S5 [Candidatus Dadabacteria bacterium]
MKPALKRLIYDYHVERSECADLEERTVMIKRVAKVVKGGRRFGFTALVIAGDGQGHVGFGLGHAVEVPAAIKKGAELAKRQLVKIPMHGTTVPHEIWAKHGATKVMIKPAKPGTGIIANAALRAIAELAGIKDIRTKCLGARSAQNMVRAMFLGLLSMETPQSVLEKRGLTEDKLDYKPF